jgi:hypothetical protein
MLNLNRELILNRDYQREPRQELGNHLCGHEQAAGGGGGGTDYVTAGRQREVS